MEHRGEKIQLVEAPAMAQLGGDSNYVVSRQQGLVFAAHCRFGTAFARRADQAFEDAKTLIDASLGISHG